MRIGIIKLYGCVFRLLRNLLLIGLIATLIPMYPIVTFATESIESTPAIINDYVNSINKKDQNKYERTLSAEDQKQVISKLDHSPSGHEIGISGVKSANIKEIKELNIGVAKLLTNYDYYLKHYDSIKTYLIGFDFRVYKESKYFFNGVNYRLVLIGHENGIPYIIENSVAPLVTLNNLGLGFNSKDEEYALKIEEERLNGRIVNKEGVLLDSNIASFDDVSTEKGIDVLSQPEDSVDKDPVKEETIEKESFKEKEVLSILNLSPYKPSNQHLPPSNIRVLRTSTNTIQTPSLYNYIRGVLPNEWLLYTTPKVESLKAGAMAIKMVAFYRVWYPKYPNDAYDVKDTTADQVYNPESGKETSATISAINSVGGLGVETSSGILFYPSYAAGVSGQAGPQSGGQLKQRGSDYLSDQGRNWLWIFHYYYDNATVEISSSPYTTASAGVIRPFFYDGTSHWNSGESLIIIGYVTGQTEKWFKVSNVGGYRAIETYPYGNSDPDTVMELYDQNLNLLTSDDNSGGGNYSRISNYYLNSGSTYYVKVKGKTSGTSVYSALELSTVNNQTTSILGYASGSAVYNFAVVGDGRKTSFETSFYSSTSDTYLELYNSANVLIASNDDHGVGNYSLISKVILNVGQTYYVRVRNYSNGSPVYAAISMTR